MTTTNRIHSQEDLIEYAETLIMIDDEANPLRPPGNFGRIVRLTTN